MDPTIADADLRPRIYDLIGAGQLAEAVEEAERLARPADGNYFDLLEARYSQVRQYTPAVLAALRFNSNRSDDQLLAAVELLQELNARGRRAVPDDAPTAFASRRWQPYLHREAAASTGTTGSCVFSPSFVEPYGPGTSGSSQAGATPTQPAT